MGNRLVTMRGVIGALELDERYYNHCDHCQAAEFTGNELGGNRVFTQLAEERMALLGKDGTYAKSAALIERLGKKIRGLRRTRKCTQIVPASLTDNATQFSAH
jgi:hypothetical protein